MNLHHITKCINKKIIFLKMILLTPPLKVRSIYIYNMYFEGGAKSIIYKKSSILLYNFSLLYVIIFIQMKK